MRKQDPDARGNLLAALEYGVSPLAPADYSKTRQTEHRPLKPRPDRYALRRRAQAHVAAVRPTRKTRGLIVTAEDIMAGRGGAE